jgi:putative transposase
VGDQSVCRSESAERTKRRREVGKALRDRKQVVEKFASAEGLAKRALVKETSSEVTLVEAMSASAEEGSLSVSSQMQTEVPKRPKIRWYDNE